MFLIYDIETSQKDKSKSLKDLENNKLRYFGAYSTLHKKLFIYTEKEKSKIKKLIKEHKWFIGYNNAEFDDPIMNFEKCKIPRYKSMDLLQIIQKRLPVIKYKGEMLSSLMENFKLDTVGRVLELGRKISPENDPKLNKYLKKRGMKNIYEMLNQDQYNKYDDYLIRKYLKFDVELTAKLWNWIYKYFDNFKHFLKKKDIEKFEHIKSAISVYSYKVICNLAGIKEEYARDFSHEKFEGAYVSIPHKETVTGKIYCYDFNSLYPSIMIMSNIYAPKYNSTCKECNKCFNGSKFKVEGEYCSKKLCKVGNVLKQLYERRLEFKKDKDEREHAVKIVINTLYGLLGNPNFEAVYNLTAASDVARLARQFIKYASKCFEKAGYEILYNDTDSCYILDKVGNYTRLEKVKDKIIKNIKSQMPFEFKHFDMGLDYEIKAMFFFKDKKDKFKKKNYAYITKNDKLIVKGLKVIKSDCSKLSKHIFNKYLKPIIMKEYKSKFTKKQIYNLLKECYEEDNMLIVKRNNLKPKTSYKVKTSLQYQLSERYGDGITYIVCNSKYGVGKSKKKYCSIEDFKTHNLTFKDLNLDIFYNELQPFIIDIDSNVFNKSVDSYFS